MELITNLEIDPRRQARLLYFALWRVSEIAELLGVPVATVAAWKSRDEWDKASPSARAEDVTEAKYVQLVLKEPKSGSDVRDIDLLGRQMVNFARMRRYEEPGGHEGHLNPKIGARNAGPKKKPVRNYFSEEQAAKLAQAFRDELFGYQNLWLDSSSLRTRMILKSRQIGATWYFAREALLDAIETGRNQIFLSASKNQAHVFRRYILDFAKSAAGVDLTGDPIVIDRGEGQEPATLYFLGTNARTAQGYHGNFYFDEFFWTFQFQNLNKVASGMAMHKKWRKTYFSTPSSITHEAYPFWTGEQFNKRRPKAERAEFDTSWSALKGGLIGADRIWRNIITLDDAAAGGCDLFDVDELRLEYSPDQFANLLMCEFVDDTLSVFPMRDLQGCLVDSWEAWSDFSHLDLAMGQRPYHGKVWVGYDPSATGDSAALVVCAPPPVLGQGKFRLLERRQFRGMDFSAQAAEIKKICDLYDVEYIGIDATGIGLAVHQLVVTFFPRARKILYSAEVKTRMVLKAKDTVTRGRLEYDAGWSDLSQAFLAIRKTLTNSGQAVTYMAGRDENGHADLAWATMHILDNEPLEAVAGGVRRSKMEIS